LGKTLYGIASNFEWLELNEYLTYETFFSALEDLDKPGRRVNEFPLGHPSPLLLDVFTNICNKVIAIMLQVLDSE